MKGPFYDPSNGHRSNATKCCERNWEIFDDLSRMANVGRKGRLKSRTALEKQAMENMPRKTGLPMLKKLLFLITTTNTRTKVGTYWIGF